MHLEFVLSGLLVEKESTVSSLKPLVKLPSYLLN